MSLFFCERHNECEHSKGFSKNHKRLRDFSLIANLKDKKPWSPSEEDRKNDLQNLFCLLNTASSKLRPGPKFDHFKDIIKEESAGILSVSFIAETGAGKSRLIRALCDPPGPLTAPPSSHTPTSGNICAYFSRDSNVGDVIYFDCEGSGNTNLPRAEQSRLQMFQETKNLQTSKKTIILGTYEKSNTENKRLTRYQFVDTAYPRLLYLFSSVICFPFRGSLQQRQFVIEKLTHYSNTAASGTISEARQPSVIIIFNRVPFEDYKGWEDPYIATQRWVYEEDHDESNRTSPVCERENSGLKSRDRRSQAFRGNQGLGISPFSRGNLKDDMKNLRLYYNNIQVVAIPDASEHPVEFLEAMSTLKELIQRELILSKEHSEKIGLAWSKKYFFSLFRYAMAKFSDNPKGGFHLFEEYRKTHGISPKDINSFLLTYFFSIYDGTKLVFNSN